MPSTSKTPPEWEQLLGGYPDGVQDIALKARQLIVTKIPNVVETVDTKAKVIGYGFAPGYAGLICTIILSKTGVKLGLVGGASLPDPKRLLEGSGKVHRYIAFAKPADVSKPGVKSLLASGIAEWKKSKSSIACRAATSPRPTSGPSSTADPRRSRPSRR